MTPTEVRLALKAAGFSPIPCKDKAPLLSGWQNKLDISDAEMRLWPGANTGMLTKFNTASDIDITDPEAADAVEREFRDWFDGRGTIPARFGNGAKRALVFRTQKPFAKFSVRFRDLAGNPQKIEILCDGQQLIAHGTHPDTGKPYHWVGQTPWEMGNDALVEVTEEEMRECVEWVAGVLVGQFGYERVEGYDEHTAGNGQDPEHADGGNRGPVNIEAEMDSIVDGATANAATSTLSPACWARVHIPTTF